MTSTRRRLVAAAALSLAGCADAASTPGATSAPSAAPAPPSAAPAPPSAAPSGSASASDSAAALALSGPPPSATTSWLGVPTDASVALPVAVTWGGTRLRLPEGWAVTGIDNGMSESDDGKLAFLRAPRDPKAPLPSGETRKSALVILCSHAAVHDALLDYGGPARLAMTGGISNEWGPIRKVEIGGVAVEVLEGKGKWGVDDAELWQVRRKHPTSKNHGTTDLVLAALRLPATDEVRRGLLAGLASLVVE